MASQSHQSLLFLCLLVYTLTFVFCFLPPTCEADGDGERVDVTLYYETLCPYCSYFIAHDLIRVFTDQLLPIVNLKLVPWGNAALDPSGNFQCQHGQGECLLNTVEACAINVFPDVSKHFSFIQCIESLAYQRKEGDWRTCFARASVDPNPVFDCYNKGNGRQLELQYAYETAALNPPHTFVPWLLVNNQPLKEVSTQLSAICTWHNYYQAKNYLGIPSLFQAQAEKLTQNSTGIQDYQNFVSYVCMAYKGPAPPKVCNKSRLETDRSREKAEAAQNVCYSEEPKNLTSLDSIKSWEEGLQ